MNAQELAAKALADFDALAEKPASVSLTRYETEKQWAMAPEKFGTLADGQEAVRLITEGLMARGVKVEFAPPPERTLTAAFDVRAGNAGVNIGWAVFSTPKKPKT